MGNWKPSSTTFSELNDHLDDGRWQQAESVARRIYQHYYQLNAYPPHTFSVKQGNGIRLAAMALRDLLKEIKERKKTSEEFIAQSNAAYQKLKESDLIGA